MAKRFTEITAARIKTVGMHKDELCVGLHLQVTKSSKGIARSWAYRFRSPVDHRVRWMGLGPLDLVTVKDARQRATELRRKVRLDGVDPLNEKHQRLATERARFASSMTFAQCAEQFLAEQSDRFSNAKHAAQWKTTLGKACDALGKLDVSLIDTPMLTKFLLPIYKATPETGKRLRGRVEKVLDWATVHEFRKGPNPARWKGCMEHVMPTRESAKKHHAALAYADLPALCELLRGRQSLSAKALEFTILTAARSGEVLGATWDEIDLDARTWTIPAERMKARVEHVVPLTDRAIELLQGIDRKGEMVFPLSNMAMTQLLRKAGHKVTVHGMRSAFRDWAGETNAAERVVIEMSLAHQLRDKAEKAYYRSNEIDRRRVLLDKWSAFLANSLSTVVQFPVAS